MWGRRPPWWMRGLRRGRGPERHCPPGPHTCHTPWGGHLPEARGRSKGWSLGQEGVSPGEGVHPPKGHVEALAPQDPSTGFIWD